ncbi:hypothetical protein Ddye_008435 [Dipteronia dyeriana]|uniref:RNase H type-1 domain-containing protein n=1 Tax=Dipteronia dyeriana TaxID=168575 RepID=A0AAD9X9T2_9ROSI|nr:hypothetical protein Ddye_008435 [Dipteronia dyeriana]
MQVYIKVLSMEDMAVLFVVMWRNWFRRNRIVHRMPDIDLCDVAVWSKAFVSNYRKANEVARKTNYVAHYLAKMAFCLSEDCFWIEDFPSCVRGYLQKDHPGCL